MKDVSALSKQYIRVIVKAKDENGVDIVIGSDVVEFAFMLNGNDPASLDWKTGAWGAANVARIMIGPGTAAALVAGNQYQVWVRVTDNPEVPVLKVDALNVT
jgi:hypothetical protein